MMEDEWEANVAYDVFIAYGVCETTIAIFVAWFVNSKGEFLAYYVVKEQNWVILENSNILLDSHGGGVCFFASMWD